MWRWFRRGRHTKTALDTDMDISEERDRMQVAEAEAKERLTKAKADWRSVREAHDFLSELFLDTIGKRRE